MAILQKWIQKATVKIFGQYLICYMMSSVCFNRYGMITELGGVIEGYA